MDQLRLIIVLLTINLSSVIFGFPNGAPSQICNSLIPKHSGTSIERSYPPYQILPAAGQGRIRVILGSPQGLAYKGFIITARSIENDEYVGEFTNFPSDIAKTVECTPGLKNGLTHTDNSEKHNIEFDWEAPADYDGTIIFNSTFVQDFSTYWTGIESPPITVLGRTIEVMTSPIPPTTQRPTTPPYYETPAKPTNNEAARRRRAIYDGCDSTKSCFSVPDGCIETISCKALVAVEVKGERYIFELMGDGAKYVAVGLSTDKLMGDDSVIECVENSGKITIHTSWNNGRKNERLVTPDGAINLLESYYEDRMIYCKYTREKLMMIKGNEFDLENRAYYRLLAMGKELKQNGVGYHDILREASSEAKRLSDTTQLAAADDVLVRVHGGLMIASWIGTASIGMLLARYYKTTWLKSQLCGKDQWFTWHRFFMILTWSMTIAGFVVIFVEIGTWSSATIHASLGLATTLLAFIQPFMAIMRPHPGTPRRPLFNWSHWFIGNTAHICGIVALFFAVRLTKAKLPEWVDWILTAYVVFHFLTHIVLSFAGCAADRQDSGRINAFPMKDMQMRNSMGHPDARSDAPLAAMRKLIFAIYFIVIVGCVVVLIIITVLAPIEESWMEFIDAIKSP